MKTIVIILIFTTITVTSAQQDEIIDTTNFYSRCTIIGEFHSPSPDSFGTTVHIIGVSLIDSMNYITAVEVPPYRLFFFSTEDGGKNWNIISYIDISSKAFPGSNISAPKINEFKMTTEGIGIISTSTRQQLFPSNPLSDTGYVWRTTDYGISWDYFYTGFKGNLLDLSFDNNGIAYFQTWDNETNKWHIALSTDDGLTWTSMVEIDKKEEKSIWHVLTPENGCLIYSLCNYQSGDSLLYFIKTTDYGSTWDTTMVNLKFSLNDRIGFADKSNGWYFQYIRTDLLDTTIVDLNIFKTSDGGKTWEKQFNRNIIKTKISSLPCGYRFIIYDKNIAIFTFLTGSILMTIDSGSNWYEIGDKLINRIPNLGNFLSANAVLLHSKSLTKQIQKLEFETPTTLIDYLPKNNNESLLYPNPVKRGKSINLYIAKDNIYRAEIKIFDINGRFIAEFNNSNVKLSGNKVSVDNINIPAGVYLVQPVINEKDFKTRKLIITE
jgi:hypothetical protein